MLHITGSSAGTYATGVDMNTVFLSLGPTSILNSLIFCFFYFFPARVYPIEGVLKNNQPVHVKNFQHITLGTDSL